jgi:tetratricopeptide (TPR) repeat protein
MGILLGMSAMGRWPLVSARPQVTRALDEARAAFARSDWEAAREHFQRGLDAEISAEALDGLGQTLWWLGEEETAIELRTKAFAEYQRRGDVDAAANVAIYLASEYRISGNASVANGWLGAGGPPAGPRAKIARHRLAVPSGSAVPAV